MHRGSLPLTPIIITFFSIVAFLGVMWFALPKNEADENTNTANQVTNTGLNDTNTAIGNTNEDRTLVTNVNANITVNANINPSTNTGFPANTNTIPTTTSTLTAYTVAEAITQATQLDGQTLCLRGDYQTSFEFMAFGSGTQTDADGHPQVTAPYVWVGFDVPVDESDCWTTARVGQSICLATVTACGVFDYAAPGEDGFGHVQAYRYQLRDQVQNEN